MDEAEAGAGVIVHVSKEVTVVAIPSSCTRDQGTKLIAVRFFDGTRASSDDVIRLNHGGLDLLFVGVSDGGWTAARLGRIGGGESEAVLTIVPLVKSEANYLMRSNAHQQRTYTSYIIAPRCSCVNIGGSKIHETSEFFAFNLPVGNNVRTPDSPEIKLLHVDNFVLGSPVFNMEGEYVGFPLKRISTSRDFKFGMRGDAFQRSLNTWLDGRQWEVAIQPYVDKYAEMLLDFDWY
ncbi:unnamed protein product [Urochloa decumbens]|uniref:Uncharacterized protein n=1 Tax=Urochloa decumbens TaxID=240449 RepID=A0ABC9BIF1_9POAL